MKIKFGIHGNSNLYRTRVIVENVGGFTIDLSPLETQVEYCGLYNDESSVDVTVEWSTLTLENTKVYLMLDKSKYFNTDSNFYKEIQVKPEHEQKAYEFFKKYIDLFELRE
jgi:hypothetical protein